MTGSLATLEPRVLTVCAYPEFAPFAFERDGEIVGTDIELLRRFAHQEGLRLRTTKCPFRDLWQRPGLGDCDVAAAGLAALPERDLTAHGVWSAPYATVRRSLLIRSGDADRLRVPADFRGRKIVATPHSTAEHDARRRYQPWGAELILMVASQQAVVQALLRREIDAFAEGDLSSRYLAERYGDGRAHAPLVLADVHEMERVETLHFAVRASDARLVARLDAFLPRCPGGGELQGSGDQPRRRPDRMAGGRG
jgi:ABC-type amino acid transport substrate-binding protein